jgi:hypothetical protein
MGFGQISGLKHAHELATLKVIIENKKLLNKVNRLLKDRLAVRVNWDGQNVSLTHLCTDCGKPLNECKCKAGRI